MEDGPEMPQRDEPPRVRLEYFAANLPRADASGWRMFRWILLGVGWLPFGCGVISSQAVVAWGVADVIRVHVNGGAMLMGAGTIISLACGVGFLRAREYAGAVTAGVSLVVQIVLFSCVGGIR